LVDSTLVIWTGVIAIGMNRV